MRSARVCGVRWVAVRRHKQPCRSGTMRRLPGWSGAPAMVEVSQASARVAPGPSTVLILGESGTGKELIARAIHQHSPRRARPFVAVDCTSLTETLLESELFGYVRGAFTGAVRDATGLFAEADGGTLFL